MAPSKKAGRPAKKKARPVPSEIAPGVFVGGWDDAESFSGKRFCVLDELPEDAPADAHVPIYDSDHDKPIVANLDRLARMVGEARAAHEPVLIFCGHGVRRSPMGGAWYLHRSEHLALRDAYARIRAVRPKIEEAREWVGDSSEIDRAE